MTRDFLIVGYIAMLLTWLAVVVVFWAMTRGHWRRSPEGRLMMADAALFVWLAALVLAGVFLHDWPGRIPMSVASVYLISVTGLWRLKRIVTAQRDRRRLAAKRGREDKMIAGRGRHESDRR